MKLSVEIPYYKAVNKGALQAFFTMIIHPIGIKFVDCKYFCYPGNQDRRWFAFPSKEIKKDSKVEYLQLVHVLNQKLNEELKTAVLLAIDAKINEGKNYGQESVAASGEEDSLQSGASLLW